jgi:hypothetical protein
MSNAISTPPTNELPGWMNLFSALPWQKVFEGVWNSITRKLVPEGVYEELDYEATLEIHDPKGIRATFHKHKKVRYLQDNIIAFQDYAWGDGEILINYRTSKGKPVDRYRSGFKTYILLSLREVRNRGEIDEFNIQWNIRRGFLTQDGYWGADVSQPTKHIKMNIIFPKSRPPLQLTIEENHSQRSRILGNDALKQLPDGRWMVTWETSDPRLYELYVLRWMW